jgi:1-acyl-sn-glycerol-3-phosphate acyltransferase
MREHLLFAARVAATLGLMTAGAALMSVVALVTGFRLRRFYSEGLATVLGRTGLRIWGIRIVRHDEHVIPEGQVVYVSNHTSTIDLFVLIALGLPNARFFLSGFLRKLVPLGIIGYLIGVFWTIPQAYSERRRQIFRRATDTLRRTGESVYLSPEGERVTSGLMGHFNRGAFHLATALKAPIVPLFIAVPSAIDPGRGLRARPGIVCVYFHAPIITRDWREEDVDANKDAVREKFLEWNALYRRES